MGLAAALLMLSVGALASPSPTLTDGIDLYHSFEFEQAVFRFQRAAVEPGSPSTDRAIALVWLGMAQAALGDLAGAEHSFLEAHHVVPGLTLPEEVSPKVSEIFEKARADAAASPLPAPTPPDPPRHAPQPPTTAPAAPTRPALLVGGVISAAGAAGLIGAGAMLAVAFERVSFAEAPTTFQDEAKIALDTANGLATGSAILASVGTLALIGGGIAAGIAAAE